MHMPYRFHKANATLYIILDYIRMYFLRERFFKLLVFSLFVKLSVLVDNLNIQHFAVVILV